MNQVRQAAVEAPGESSERLKQRRGDVESKQAFVAELLRQAGCEGLLMLRPENFSWFTGGATAPGCLDPSEAPALFCNAEQRWLLSANTDTQRLFDDELDGLAFQLKEWPWHWGRAQCLAELCEGKVIACDQPFGDSVLVTDKLARARRTLNASERIQFRDLGRLVSHALEATCRSLTPNITEREIAGHLGHRLLQHGAVPVSLSVACDERARLYRHPGFTEQPLRKHGILTVTAARNGLHVAASRSLCFGPPDAVMRQEYDAACKVSATYVLATRPNAVVPEIFQSARRVYQISGFEHDWLNGPQGHITGRRAVELTLRPSTEELLQVGWGVTWRAVAGAAVCCNTFLVTEEGVECVTTMEAWPVKRIRFQGEELVLPYLLVR